MFISGNENVSIFLTISGFFKLTVIFLGTFFITHISKSVGQLCAMKSVDLKHDCFPESVLCLMHTNVHMRGNTCVHARIHRVLHPIFMRAPKKGQIRARARWCA